MLLHKNGKYTVNKTTRTDINYVSENMRPVDAMEVFLSDGLSPYHALRESVERSDEAYTMCRDGKAFAIFGISTNKMSKSHAAIWMLATNDLYNNVKGFHDITLKYLKYFYKNKAEILFNFVSERNQSSIHWLEQLGAIFSKPQPYGKHKTNFKYFELRGG